MANIEDQTEAMGIILEADCRSDAEQLHKQLQEVLPRMNIIIHSVGPVIGAHAGPGTLAFCFLGKRRPM